MTYSFTDVHKPLQLVVGKIDAGVAILLYGTGDHHILEFPTLLLPPDIATGSIIDISVSRNIQAETESLLQFTHLQDAILADLGDTDPTPPKLKAANTTLTSVVLQWSDGVATAPDTILELLVNDDIIASHPVQPGPLSGECQVDGLEQGYEYTCQVLLRVGTLTVSGELLVVKTLGDREVGSNTSSVPASPSTNLFPKRRASSTTLAVPASNTIPEVSDNHQVSANEDKSTTPPSAPVDMASVNDPPLATLDQPISINDMSVLDLDRAATIDPPTPNLTFPTPLGLKSPPPLTPFNQPPPLPSPSVQNNLGLHLDFKTIELGSGSNKSDPLNIQSPIDLLDVMSVPLPKSMDSSKPQTPAATSIIASPTDQNQMFASLMDTFQNHKIDDSQKDLVLVNLDSSQADEEVVTNDSAQPEVSASSLSEVAVINNNFLKEPENIQLPSSPVMDL